MRNFEEIGKAIGRIVTEKNKYYENSVTSTNDILRCLYPYGIKPEQYSDLNVIVRIIDKIMRITKGNQGNESAYKDIAGYALLKYTIDLEYEFKSKDMPKDAIDLGGGLFAVPVKKESE